MRFTKDGQRFRNKCGCYGSIESLQMPLSMEFMLFQKVCKRIRKEAVWCGIVCFVIRQNVLSLFFMMLICLTLLTLARSVF